MTFGTTFEIKKYVGLMSSSKPRFFVEVPVDHFFKSVKSVVLPLTTCTSPGEEILDNHRNVRDSFKLCLPLKEDKTCV